MPPPARANVADSQSWKERKEGPVTGSYKSCSRSRVPKKLPIRVPIWFSKTVPHRIPDKGSRKICYKISLSIMAPSKWPLCQLRTTVFDMELEAAGLG